MWKEYFTTKKLKTFHNRIKMLWIKVKTRLTGQKSRCKRLNRNSLATKLSSKEVKLKTQDHKSLQITEANWIIRSKMV